MAKPSGGAFQEVGGLVVIEAEHSTARLARGGQEWVTVTDRPGSIGDGAVASLPNNGVIITSGGIDASPKLVYRVNFSTPGNYRFFLKAAGDTGADNSAYVGVDDVPASWWINVPSDGQWHWDNQSITIPAPGEYDVCVWMREDGLYIDRLVLTLDPSLVPNDSLPESSR